MILEAIAVSIVALILGAVVMYLLLKIKKIEQKIDRSEKKKFAAMKDPELLLKKLNENGQMVDDGDGISFSVEIRDGKKQLVQKIEKNIAAKGSPNIKGTQRIKTTTTKKVVSKNGNPKKK